MAEALPNRTQIKKLAVRGEDKKLVLGATCRAILAEHGPLTTTDVHMLIDRMEEDDIGVRSVRHAIYYLRQTNQAIKGDERAWELTDAGFAAAEG